MHPWSQATIADYRRLPLRAHSYFSDVPIYDVWRVALPGIERSCTMLDVRATIRAMATEAPPGFAVRSLFALRRLLGSLFRWDAPEESSFEWSWRRRLATRDLEASTVPTGTLDGPFSVLYAHATEAVSEIRNRTVHAFLVLAIEPAPGGHTLYFAIHVLPVSAWTRPYLAMIKPFRLWIVYPSLLRRLHEAWSRGLGADV
ncbi:MAG TPA: DUF2867 domain-containing protein [Blastocatellia bacterium]|nr:DUF2867 domain-containing protein [Blastocatellia bacterium]